MTEEYNKLIRDQIPEIIKENGKEPVFRTLNDDEYKDALFEKLLEESKELFEEKAGEKKDIIKEISDVYEVIDAIIELYEIEKASIEKVKNDRKEKRGAFKKRLFLEIVK